MSYKQVAFAIPPPASHSVQQENYLPNLNIHLQCPDCKDPHPNIVEEFAAGDLVCGNCGFVLQNRIIDTRSEWRTFANDEGDDPSRVGAAANPLMDGMEQLDTVIGFRDGGSGIARELQRAAARTVHAKAGKMLTEGFKVIGLLCDSMSLPKLIQDTAKQLFKRVDESKLLKGKEPKAIVGACVFIACRTHRVPRTFREICKNARTSKKALGQCFKTMEAFFKTNPGGITQTENNIDRHMAGNVEKSGPEDLVARYCNHLGLPVTVERACYTLIVRGREQGINAGRSPISIAGGAIFFTTNLLGQPKSTKDISRVAEVSEGTIRLVYKGFLKEKEAIVPQDWLDEGKASFDRLPAAN